MSINYLRFFNVIIHMNVIIMLIHMAKAMNKTLMEQVYIARVMVSISDTVEWLG